MSTPTHSVAGAPIVVVGSGHAAVSAAVQLADLGHPVVLAETPEAQGEDAGGLETDFSHHAVLRACTHLLALYRRLGVAADIDWQRVVHFMDPGDARVHDYVPSDLPAPMHVVQGVLGLDHMDAGHKARVLWGLLGIVQVSDESRLLQRGQSMREWLTTHGQDDETIAHFWTPLIALACNKDLADLDASYGLRVVQEAFLSDDLAGQVGVSAVSRQDLLAAAEKRVLERGGRVVGHQRVHAIHAEGGRITHLEMGDGSRLEAAAYVFAVSHERMHQLASPALRALDERLGLLDHIEEWHVAGVHLFYRDGADLLLPAEHLVVTGEPVRFLFDRGSVGTEKDAGLRHVHAVLTAAAAERLADTGEAEMTQLVALEIEEMLPALPRNRLIDAKVVRERRAAAAPRPGGLPPPRPRSTGAVANLFLAGDWCASGWPTTMEGAVRSGAVAAAAAHQFASAGKVDDPEALLSPDAPRGALYELVAG